MRYEKFDMICWIVLGVSTLYTTIYSTYRIIESYFK